jgi:hypothetical protein
MTPAEHLTKLIREKVPRLQGWEVEGLVRHLMENGMELKTRCPGCGSTQNPHLCPRDIMVFSQS